MDIIGKVLKIVDHRYVLVELKQWRSQTKFTVCQEVCLPDSDILLLVPKGQLRIALKQEDDVYLMERFREYEEQQSPYSALFGQGRVRVATGWSADLDTTNAPGLPGFKPEVMEGDLVV